VLFHPPLAGKEAGFRNSHYRWCDKGNPTATPGGRTATRGRVVAIPGQGLSRSPGGSRCVCGTFSPFNDRPYRSVSPTDYWGRPRHPVGRNAANAILGEVDHSPATADRCPERRICQRSGSNCSSRRAACVATSSSTPRRESNQSRDHTRLATPHRPYYDELAGIVMRSRLSTILSASRPSR
jgi:hypothetical protein